MMWTYGVDLLRADWRTTAEHNQRTRTRWDPIFNGILLKHENRIGHHIWWPFRLYRSHITYISFSEENFWATSKELRLSVEVHVSSDLSTRHSGNLLFFRVSLIALPSFFFLLIYCALSSSESITRCRCRSSCFDASHWSLHLSMCVCVRSFINISFRKKILRSAFCIFKGKNCNK